MLGILVIIVGILAALCKGQSNKQFQWQFNSTPEQLTELGTCVIYPIVVKPSGTTANTSQGVAVPPFYMISFPIGGIPMTTLIGSDPDLLEWTVEHAVGSKVLLNVVDSTGGAGETPPQFVTTTSGLSAVIAGETTKCVVTPAKPDPPFTLTADVTGRLAACQPLGIQVSGGTPPYTITLAETNTPLVTNVSMSFDTEIFNYPHRAVPDAMLVVGVSDAEGLWADGTPSILFEGSSDVSCPGEDSLMGDTVILNVTNTSTKLEALEDTEHNAQLAKSKRRRSLIASITVTIVFLLVMGCGYLLYRRHAQMRRERNEEQCVRQYSPLGSSGSTPSREGPNTLSTVSGAASRTAIYEKRKKYLYFEPSGTARHFDAHLAPAVDVTAMGNAAIPSGPQRNRIVNRGHTLGSPISPFPSTAPPPISVAVPLLRRQSSPQFVMRERISTALTQPASRRLSHFPAVSRSQFPIIAREQGSNTEEYVSDIETTAETQEESLPPKYRSGPE